MYRFFGVSIILLAAGLWALAQDVNNPQTNANALTSGTLAAARMPALTGDCTTSAGAVATTCTKTNNTAFTSYATAAVGQLPGETSNASATAGNIGEYMSCNGSGALTTTASSTNTSPNITWTGHGLTAAANNYAAVYIPTTAPTGFSTNTNYFLTFVDANTIKLSSTIANAIAGTFISAGSTTSNVTLTVSAFLSTTASANFCGLSLTAGDWDISGASSFVTTTATTTDTLDSWTSQSSATVPSVNVGTRSSLYSIFTTTSTSISQALPTYRNSLSGTTTLYASGRTSFSTGTVLLGGLLRARRAR